MSPDEPVTALKECRRGRMLYLRHDKYIGSSLEYYGEYSEFEADLFSKILRPNDFAIEVGANIGAHTVHLARLVGPQGRVFAFEPQRVIFQFLCANVALNGLFNVLTYLRAAGRERGTLRVPSIDYTAPLNFGGFSLLDMPEGGGITVMPLDELNLPSLRFLKIDVEGMEIDVLNGARHLIARHRPILYVENDQADKSPPLIALIEELGYDMWWHTPPLFNPKNYAGNPDNIYRVDSNKIMVSINILCISKENPIRILGFRKVSGPNDWSWSKHMSY